MKKLIVFSDLDGTIIKHNDGVKSPRSILQKDKKYIQNIDQSNHVFVLSTGGNFKSVEQLFHDEDINIEKGYFITSNGSQVYDSNKKLLFSSRLEKKTIETIYRIFKETSNNDKLTLEVFDGCKISKFNHNTITSNLKFLLENNFINICVYSNNNDINDLEDFLNKIQFVEATVSQNNWYVDILPENTSKASAMLFILELLKIDKENTVTISIGDSWNDISMFEMTNFSYTFYTSPANVKDKASGLVNHFYEAIEQTYKNL